MSIGTTVEVGFDAREVKQGLSGMGGWFKSASLGFGKSMMKGVAIGGALTGATLLGLGLKTVSGIADTMKYAGDMEDMSVQTGMTIDKLIELEEAFRIAGVAGADTSKMISTFAANIQDARDAATPTRDAIHKLGFTMTDFVNSTPEEAFRTIGQRVAELGPELKGLENIMEDIFGAKIGYGMIRLFKDMGQMTKARENVKGFAQDFAASAHEMAEVDDRLEQIGKKMKGLHLNIFRAFSDVFNADNVESMIKKIFDYDRLKKFFEEVKLRVGEIMASVSEKGVWETLKEIFRDIGRALGEGIGESLKGTILGKLDPSTWFGGGEKKSTTSNNLELKEAQKHTTLLDRIAKQEWGWA